MIRHAIALATAVLGLGLVVATPAAAGTGKTHCAAEGFCLFSFTDYQGVSKAVDMAPGCHAVLTLGMQQARSAARGLGSGYNLVLFTDFNCHSVFDMLIGADLHDTYAQGYVVVPVST